MLTAVGIAVGLGAASVVASRIAADLYQVRASDPVTLVAVPALIGAVGLTSGYRAATIALSQRAAGSKPENAP